MRNILVASLILMATLASARAQTPCPEVSSQIQTLNPTIINAPFPVSLAIYDQVSNGLAIQAAGQGNPAIYFVGVPPSLIVGQAYVDWYSFQSYPQALVQTNSTCPILSSTGYPILTTGTEGYYPTVSPYVTAPCLLVSANQHIQTVGFATAPKAIYEAVYDADSQYLTVIFADGTADMFVGVPKSAVAAPVQWNSLSVYQEAIMAQGVQGCPLLAQ